MDLKFPKSKLTNHVRRNITYLLEDTPEQIVIRTKFDTFKIPETLSSYLTKISGVEDTDDYDIDFPD